LIVKRPAVLLAGLVIAAVVVGAPLADSVGPSLSISESSAYEYVSGSTTLYYAPTGSNTGSFTVTATWPGSSIASVDFPAVFSDDPAGGTTTSHTYNWTASASDSGSKTATVTSTGTPAKTGTPAFVVTPDKTAPTGQTVTLSGGPGYSTLSVPLLLGNGTDAGAGVDGSSGVLERASATLATGTCGTSGSYAAVTLSGGADTTVTSGSCYRYQYKTADNVGNISTASTTTVDAKVDVTPPTTPILHFSGLTNTAASGSVVYYRATGSGTFTVTATATDGESGVASYAFPSVSGFTIVGAGASRTFAFSSAPSVPAGPLEVTATNGTGLTSPAASFTLVPDPTPPTVTVRCNGRPCLPGPYSKAVTVAFSAADGLGSGVDTIRYTTNGTDPTRDRGTEYTGPFSVRTLARLEARAYDKAGNPSTPLAVTIRSLADRLVFSAPPRLAVRSGARYLFARITSTRRGIVSATMTGPNLKTPQRWRFILGSGTSIVQLRLPTRLARTGRYKVVWTVRAGTQKTTRTTLVALGVNK
jgi:chitobiase/beta-hexosaminidase-like protein